MKERTILFVDDDRYEMLGLVERLEAAGFKVVAVTNPAMALHELREGLRPDLVISDLIMPSDPEASPLSNRHVGIEFCRKVNDMDLNIPILVLTVVTDPVVQAEARKYATGLLVKPVTPNNLLRRVEDALLRELAEEALER